MAENKQQLSGTKDLKQIMGFSDLMAMAVGQIIGAGIMVISISGLQMTGRSVNLAFMLAAFFTIMSAIPSMLIGSTVRLRGGTYTQYVALNGALFAGYTQAIAIISVISISKFAIGMASYLGYVIPSVNDHVKLWQAGLLLLFFVLNFFGTEWMAGAQNIMFYLLLAALILFCVFGVPKIKWTGYFDNSDGLFMTGSALDFMRAGAILTSATGGGTVIIAYSADAKNPTKDIPVVIILSTVLVAIMYFFMSSVIGGVLPLDEVIAAGNLAPIAEAIMPKGCYYFFMLAGAGFALGTTLNSSIASRLRPMLQACADGWFPKKLSVLHPKFRSPYLILIIYFFANLIPIVLEMSVTQITQLTLFIGNVNAFISYFGIFNIPKVFPNEWAASKFHVSTPVLYMLMVPCMALQAFQAYLNCSGAGMKVLIFNLITFAVCLAYAYLRLKSGAVQIEKSYESK